MLVLMMSCGALYAEQNTNCIPELAHKVLPVKKNIPSIPVLPDISLQCGDNISNINSCQETKEKSADKKDNTLMVGIITASAALIGVLITMLGNYHLAKKNFELAKFSQSQSLKANIIVKERLRWLQDIRQRLANLYAQMDMQYSFLKRQTTPDQTASMQAQFDEFSEEIMNQVNSIHLMLNPSKPDQEKLKKALQEKLNFLLICFQMKNNGNTQFDDNKYTSIKNDAFLALTQIGIETWAQIKNLE